jgi:hypothetical protein
MKVEASDKRGCWNVIDDAMEVVATFLSAEGASRWAEAEERRLKAVQIEPMAGPKPWLSS